MSLQERPSLSVVIPAYNEAEVIGECLDRLIAQAEYVTEIVVVDNNSTDQTAAIVAGYSQAHSMIRMITEDNQGLVWARNAGLDAATGDLLARIDSDTLVEPDWAKTVVEFFAADGEERWAAACGRGQAYGLPHQPLLDRVERITKVVRRPSTKSATVEPKDVPVLYGSNMILRREVWAAIRDQVSMRRDVFEDVDTGLCVQESGGRNAFLSQLTVGVSPRRMETSVSGFARYMVCLPRTLLLHRRFGLAVGAIGLYLPTITVIHALRLVVIRSYDADAQTFSLKNMGRATADRVAP